MVRGPHLPLDSAVLHPQTIGQRPIERLLKIAVVSRGQQVRVFAENRLHCGELKLGGENVDGIGAVQAQTMKLHEAIPKVLQSNRRRMAAPSPQQCHHLAIDTREFLVSPERLTNPRFREEQHA